MAQRIVRAKRTLSEAKVPFEVPTGDDLRARIPPTLEVVYLIFNEGYAAGSGQSFARRRCASGECSWGSCPTMRRFTVCSR
jgi:predicted RNA polymerase sigma factor